MDKNSITGFVLIGVIFFGFTWFQHKQDTKQREVQAQLDSVARVEQALRAAQDSAQKASGQAVMAEKPAAPAKVQNIYKDAASEAALAVEKEKDAANQISVEIGTLEV